MTKSKWYLPLFAVALGFHQIDVQATATAGVTVIVAIIIAFIVEVARGHSGAPFTWLGAIAGVSYIVAVAVLRVRG